MGWGLKGGFRGDGISAGARPPAPRPRSSGRVQATRALIAERVRRGTATLAEHLAVAVLDEMPDEDDPDAVRAWGALGHLP